jgi:hypothetical protein
MIPVDSVVDVANNLVSQSSDVLLATSASDFGGSFAPVAGLTLLGALILYLSPPLVDN